MDYRVLGYPVMPRVIIIQITFLEQSRDQSLPKQKRATGQLGYSEHLFVVWLTSGIFSTIGD